MIDLFSDLCLLAGKSGCLSPFQFKVNIPAIFIHHRECDPSRQEICHIEQTVHFRNVDLLLCLLLPDPQKHLFPGGAASNPHPCQIFFIQLQRIAISPVGLLVSNPKGTLRVDDHSALCRSIRKITFSSDTRYKKSTYCQSYVRFYGVPDAGCFKCDGRRRRDQA